MRCLTLLLILTLPSCSALRTGFTAVTGVPVPKEWKSEIMARSEVVGFDISTSDPFVDRRPFLDLQFGFPFPRVNRSPSHGAALRM